jgi:hypothetical protein
MYVEKSQVPPIYKGKIYKMKTVFQPPVKFGHPRIEILLLNPRYLSLPNLCYIVAKYSSFFGLKIWKSLVLA